MARAAPRGGLAAAALVTLRFFSLRNVTAAWYGADWQRLSALCVAGSYRALPADSVTDGCHVAYLWLRGTVQPSRTRTYLDPTRKRHVAAGYPNRCSSDPVAEALASSTNTWLDRHGRKPKWVALPALVAWQLTQLAYAATDAVLRLRLTVVVTHYFMCRRAKDVLNLHASDLSISPASAVSFQITRTKTNSKKPGGERLAHIYPLTSFQSVPDLPVLFLRRALSLRRCALEPSSRLFSAAARDPGTDLSAWLRAGLQRLALSPPVRCVSASHSCRSGGCSAIRSVGLGLDAVAQWAGMTVETLGKSFNDALLPVTLDAHFFFGRILPHALSLPI
eukprot:TRINITY_DN6331_c0_g1_i1.p1 TRINITY_DN6331_c0_g1~~TRINITY_DN6331_c0_g1_i1.p1  ORF type:complete len:335 (+),score=48.30 TRINITY_DN6331_c0_g1_i1:2133-3137(+)